MRCSKARDLHQLKTQIYERSKLMLFHRHISLNRIFAGYTVRVALLFDSRSDCNLSAGAMLFIRFSTISIFARERQPGFEPGMSCLGTQSIRLNATSAPLLSSRGTTSQPALVVPHDSVCKLAARSPTCNRFVLAIRHRQVLLFSFQGSRPPSHDVRHSKGEHH